jgi:glycosyltransferase involved in cell wall biosynthesis
MNILWIPHAPLRVWGRSNHLIPRLARRHHVSVVSFEAYPRARAWRYLRNVFWQNSKSEGNYHEVPLRRFPKAKALNGLLLNRLIGRELKRHPYDVLVIAPAPYLTGDLNQRALQNKLAIVCDYLDGDQWPARWPSSVPISKLEPSLAIRYNVEFADAVMCVSHGILEQSLTVNPAAFYVPNGVDLSTYREFRKHNSAYDCKRRLGIDPDAFTVSTIGLAFIGLACRARLYFVDAVLNLAEKGRKIILLLVGDTPLSGAIERKARRAPGVIRMTGRVPYEQLLAYFMASDMGLYATEDHVYYHFVSPLKIFEYAAMGKPVLVSPRLDEVSKTELSNVRFCEPSVGGVERGIEAVMSCPDVREPDLREYDWNHLANKVEDVLAYAVSRFRARQLDERSV